MDGVEHYHGIDAFKRPFLPFAYEWQQLVGDFGYAGRIHFDIVHFLHRFLNVLDGCPLGIQVDDFVLNGRYVRLVLLYDLRFEFAITVAGHGQFHVALATGNCLFIVTVAAIVCLLVFVVILLYPSSSSSLAAMASWISPAVSSLTRA